MHSYKEIDSKCRNNAIIIKAPRRLILEITCMSFGIECPRSSDIMTLSSDFDKLLYFCQECELSLMMK